MLCFFFSSRRRHTRWTGDWSSDVCSSDLFTLVVANNILFETGLSFLGAGVRDPDPSWGNIIQQGANRLSTAPSLALVPGIAIVLTVLSLNIFGDGLRDALDPRAKVKL